MNRFRPVLLVLALFAALAARAVAAPAPAAAQASDLVAPEKRRPIVELAQRLAKPPPPPPLAADLVQPFNPAAFGQPDPEELRAIAAAQAAQQAASAQAKPSSDSEFLRLIASRVQPTGSLMLSSGPLLIFGKKRLRVGDQFTVTYEGQNYTLDLVAIDRTTFTLRLNKEEIVRPIKPTKSP